MVVKGHRIMLKIKEVEKFAVESDDEILLSLLSELKACKKHSEQWYAIFDVLQEVYSENNQSYTKYEDSHSTENRMLNRLYVQLKQFGLISSKTDKNVYVDVLNIYGEVIACFRFPQSADNQHKITGVSIAKGYGLENIFEEWGYEYLEEIEILEEDLDYPELPIKEYNLYADLEEFADYDLELDNEFISQHKGKYVKCNPNWSYYKPEYFPGYAQLTGFGYHNHPNVLLSEKGKGKIVRKDIKFLNSNLGKAKTSKNYTLPPIEYGELKWENIPIKGKLFNIDGCENRPIKSWNRTYETVDYIEYRKDSQPVNNALKTLAFINSKFLGKVKYDTTMYKVVYGLRDYKVPQQDIPECFSEFPVMLWESIEPHLPYKICQVLWDQGIWYHTAIPQLRKLNNYKINVQLSSLGEENKDFNTYSKWVGELFSHIPKGSSIEGNIVRLVNSKALGFAVKGKTQQAWEELEKKIPINGKNSQQFKSFVDLSKKFPNNTEGYVEKSVIAPNAYEEWVETNWRKITGIDPWSTKSGIVDKLVQFGNVEPWVDYDLTAHIPYQALIKMSDARIEELRKKWYYHTTKKDV